MMMKFPIQEIKGQWSIKDQNIEGVSHLVHWKKCIRKILFGLITQLPLHIENFEFKTKVRNGKIFTICQF